MNIGVLGCGPAGLMVAHAAVEDGHDVTVISRKERSVIGGAQYAHRAIPGITGAAPDMWINVIKWGYSSGYARKVYGSSFANTSWDHFQEGKVPGWKLLNIYSRLWYLYEDCIRDQTLGWPDMEALQQEFDCVFSTIPAPRICKRLGNREYEHQFPRVEVYFEPGVPDTPALIQEDFIIYNGHLDPWYRCSRIADVAFTEYPVRLAPATRHERGWVGSKPLQTNCDCHPGIIKLGRFGKWKKGVLTHHAYEEALDRLANFEVIGDVQ